MISPQALRARQAEKDGSFQTLPAINYFCLNSIRSTWVAWEKIIPEENLLIQIPDLRRRGHNPNTWGAVWRSKKSPDEMVGRGRIGEVPFSQTTSFASSELQKLMLSNEIELNYSEVSPSVKQGCLAGF